MNFPDAIVECTECNVELPYKTHESEPVMKGVTVKAKTPCCDADGVIVAVEDDTDEEHERR